MATFTKRGKSWTAQVRLRGVSKAKTFPTKAGATAWARAEEALILSNKLGSVADVKFKVLLERYSNEVTPTKKTAAGEQYVVSRVARSFIADVNLRDLDKSTVARWRDERLAKIKPASVRREWGLLASVCHMAISEWGYMYENPFKALPRPSGGKPRDVLYTDDEITRVLAALDYDPSMPATTLRARAGAAFRFAIETAMRAGEIAALSAEHIDYELRVVTIPITKNGDARRVPLSSEAIRILKQLPSKKTAFDLTTTQLLTAFFRSKKLTGIKDKTFHDTRHLAITRLAGKLDVLDLARMVGHRNINQLLTYYNKKAEDIAALLD